MIQYEEMIKYLDNQVFLDKIYGFAYKRCNTSHEAEELCSNIILALITSIYKNPNIENFYAFMWTIARRVYADFCKQQKRQGEFQRIEEYLETLTNRQPSMLENLIEREEDNINVKKIIKEIAFLSKIYREVIIMYYLDELKISQIADKLNISETTVKQRLFSARKTIKQEVGKMDKYNTLRPIDITFVGVGNPIGNDPRTKAERMISKNLVYLCKNTALSAKEISEKLNVPMPYIEEEIEIQLKGQNGTYGLLRKQDNKYISNFIIMDTQEYKQATAAYQSVLDELCMCLMSYISENEEKILNFPFIHKQKDTKFVTWGLISQMVWCFENTINDVLASKYFIDQASIEREFSIVGLASAQDEVVEMKNYGCDGIDGKNICGYSNIKLCNIYGERIEAHFHCAHNISNDPQLLLTIKAINGINVDLLSENEREIAAKAIEQGYLEKKGDVLIPKILIIDSKDKEDFYDLANSFRNEVKDLAEKVAENLAKVIKQIVPKHLLDDYALLTMFITASLLHECIEKCIEKNILTEPQNSKCAEGTWMIVSK